jgi:hypothetical protein
MKKYTLTLFAFFSALTASEINVRPMNMSYTAWLNTYFALPLTADEALFAQAEDTLFQDIISTQVAPNTKLFLDKAEPLYNQVQLPAVVARLSDRLHTDCGIVALTAKFCRGFSLVDHQATATLSQAPSDALDKLEDALDGFSCTESALFNRLIPTRPHYLMRMAHQTPNWAVWPLQQASIPVQLKAYSYLTAASLGIVLGGLGFGYYYVRNQLKPRTESAEKHVVAASLALLYVPVFLSLVAIMGPVRLLTKKRIAQAQKFLAELTIHREALKAALLDAAAIARALEALPCLHQDASVQLLIRIFSTQADAPASLVKQFLQTPHLIEAINLSSHPDFITQTHELMHAIGRIDCLLLPLRLIRKGLPGSTLGWQAVTFTLNQQAEISFGRYTDILSGETVVDKNVQATAGFTNLVALTDTTGLQTLRAVLLAQTLGVAPAEGLRLTPFIQAFTSGQPPEIHNIMLVR